MKNCVITEEQFFSRSSFNIQTIMKNSLTWSAILNLKNLSMTGEWKTSLDHSENNLAIQIFTDFENERCLEHNLGVRLILKLWNIYTACRLQYFFKLPYNNLLLHNVSKWWTFISKLQYLAQRRSSLDTVMSSMKFLS